MVVLAARTLTSTGGRAVGLELPRRDLFIWVCAIILFNQLFDMVKGTPPVSLEQLLSDLGSVGVFQLMAWYAIFRLLASSDPAPVAQLRDFLFALALCCLVFVPSIQMIWITAVGVGIYGCLFDGGDPKLRAAGIVLAALSVQEFWGALSSICSPSHCCGLRPRLWERCCRQFDREQYGRTTSSPVRAVTASCCTIYAPRSTICRWLHYAGWRCAALRTAIGDLAIS